MARMSAIDVFTNSNSLLIGYFKDFKNLLLFSQLEGDLKVLQKLFLFVLPVFLSSCVTMHAWVDEFDQPVFNQPGVRRISFRDLSECNGYSEEKKCVKALKPRLEILSTERCPNRSDVYACLKNAWAQVECLYRCDSKLEKGALSDKKSYFDSENGAAIHAGQHRNNIFIHATSDHCGFAFKPKTCIEGDLKIVARKVADSYCMSNSLMDFSCGYERLDWAEGISCNFSCK